MSGIKLRGTGHAVPPFILTNHALAQRVDTSDEWICSRTGIQHRHHCQQGEGPTALCVQAARMALQNSGLSPADIGVCLVATLTPETLVPSTACMVQTALGMAEDTLCFDLNAACTGFLFGLHTMECLLHASPKRYGLLIGGEALSRTINWEDRGTCILFGDGAGAAVVEFRSDWPSIRCVYGCRGEDELLHMDGPGSGKPARIAMEGTKVFKFAVETVPKCMDAVLEGHGLTADQVDFFVFHQANARIIDLVVRKYAIPADKYHKNLSEYGNTSAASIPLVLSELVQQGRIRPGSRILLVGFGGGLTWGGALMEFAQPEEGESI